MPPTRSIIPDDCWYFVGAAIALAPVVAVIGGTAAATRRWSR